MIKRTINKILKSISNLPAQYKSALSRILTAIIDSINLLNNEIAKRPDSAEWNSNTKEIQFKRNGVILPNMTISGANFIKDGMVDSVAIQGDNLVITFNTDAGKSPISIPLIDVFNPNNYYNKTQIDDKLANLESTSDNNDLLIETTYSELKTLKDNSQLTPGKKYRIIDYIPIFENNVNYARYAGNQFDIILTALSNNELSENASAIKHEGDNYFNYRNLNLWQIKYSIDNLYIYQWVHHTNGKGVIYYMKDEFNNECPYDFVNIQFKRVIDNTDYWFYTFNMNENIQYCCNNKIKPYIDNLRYKLNNIVFKNAYNCFNNIFNNDCHDITIGEITTNSGTFNDNVFGNSCYNINVESYGFKNNNVFNISCHDITFKGDCNNNIFNNNCNNINLEDCEFNNFGYNCNNITLKYKDNYNIFENDCNHIIFDKRYIQYIKVESGNKYITLTTQNTTSLSSPLKNITIRQGVNNNNDESLRKTITHPTVNDEFKTIYQNSNSRTIDV